MLLHRIDRPQHNPPILFPGYVSSTLWPSLCRSHIVEPRASSVKHLRILKRRIRRLLFKEIDQSPALPCILRPAIPTQALHRIPDKTRHCATIISSRCKNIRARILPCQRAALFKPEKQGRIGGVVGAHPGVRFQGGERGGVDRAVGRYVMHEAPEGGEIGRAVERHERDEVGLCQVYTGGSCGDREHEGEDVVRFVEGVGEPGWLGVR